MLTITNIAATPRAAELLDRQKAIFQPREPGDVFALVFVSNYAEPDGTTVAGFRPGYSRHSLALSESGGSWALAVPEGAPGFYFMPKFIWRADERYVIDVASERFELLSIGPL